MTHLHSCPRCLGIEHCSDPCGLRADLSTEVDFHGDPRKCSHCRKAGRNFSAPEVAAAAGTTSEEVRLACKRGDIDLGSLSSVAKWVEGKRSNLGSYAGGCYAAALRELRLAGAVAQDLGFGVFLWVPYKEGGWRQSWTFAGELAGPLKDVALQHSKKPLALPPFSGLLQRLSARCERGPGYDSESADLRKQLGQVIGYEDPVLCRLQVRAANRKHA